MRGSWLALAGLLSLTVAHQPCGRDRPAPPAVTWVTGELFASWRAGRDLYSHLQGTPPQIVYSHHDVGDPTVALTVRGHMVAAPENASEVVVPISFQGVPGAPRTTPLPFTPSITCSAQQRGMGTFVTAYVGDGNDALLLHDVDGSVLAMQTFESGDAYTGCAVAVHTGTIAFAVRFDALVVVWLYDDTNLALLATRAIDVSPRDNWRLSLTASADDGYTVLFRDKRGRLATVAVDEHATHKPTLLPRQVDATTADLGTSSRGVFVAWLAGKRLFVRGIDSDTQRSIDIDAGASLRAIGHYDRCGVAVRTRNRVRVTELPRCP